MATGDFIRAKRIDRVTKNDEVYSKKIGLSFFFLGFKHYESGKRTFTIRREDKISRVERDVSFDNQIRWMIEDYYSFSMGEIDFFNKFVLKYDKIKAFL